MAHDPTLSPEALLAERVKAEMKTIIDEFGGHLNESVIAHEMEASVSEFSEARVKDFVPLLASRHARRRLHDLAGV